MFKRAAERVDLPGALEMPRPVVPAKADGEQILDLTVVAGGKSRGGRASSNERIAEDLTATVIGEDITVVGNLSSPGSIQVSGTVHGDVACRRLVADKTAQISGGIVADEVIVDGRVTGPIRALRVTLQSHAQVKGEISYQSFAIDKGAEYEGMAHHSDEPKRAAIDAAVASMAGPDATLSGTRPAQAVAAAVQPQPLPAQAASGPTFKRAG